MAFCLSLCFLKPLNYLHHWLFQPFFFLLVSNTLCFPWLSILEHLFFSCPTSCCNINIHHIDICNDCLYLTNRLNFNYCHKFPMKYLLHLSKFWIVCHFMSIQTTNVACISRCFLWFLTLLCCFYGCHCGLLLLFACFHIVISHSTICVILVSLPCIILCFWWCYLFHTLWYRKCIPCFDISHSVFTQHRCLLMLLYSWPLHPYSYNFEYDCKLSLYIVVKKLYVVGTCRPWANFWIHS